MITRQIIKNGVQPFSFPYDTKFTRVKTTQVAENGSLKRSSITEVYDCAEDDKQFSYRDFSLRNILALDNESLLRPIQMQESMSSGVENLAKFNNDVQAATKKAKEGAIN